MKVINNNEFLTIIPDENKQLMIDDERIIGNLYAPLDFDLSRIKEVEFEKTEVDY